MSEYILAKRKNEFLHILRVQTYNTDLFIIQYICR